MFPSLPLKQKHNFFSFSLFSACAIWVGINPICPCCMCVILLIFLSFGSFLFFSFWPCPVAYGIFVPQQGIEPASLAVKAQNLNHWTVREFPLVHSLHMTAILWDSSLSWIHFYHPSYSFITPITEPRVSWAQWYGNLSVWTCRWRAAGRLCCCHRDVNSWVAKRSHGSHIMYF